MMKGSAPPGWHVGHGWGQLVCLGRCALSLFVSLALLLSGCTGWSVPSRTLSSIAVTPPDPAIAAGATQQFKATGTFSDGTTQDLTSSVAWSSSAPNVATINAMGLATGVAAGTTTIKATSSSVAGSTMLAVASLAPTITDFSPQSASVGTLVNVTGNNFLRAGGAGPQVSLNKQGGGTIDAPIASFTATMIAFVIPTGAATGPLTVTVGTQSATSSAALSVTAASSFSLVAAPGTGTVIQGQATSFAVTLSSTNGFSQLAALSVSGLPAGVTATLTPTQITAGQTALLTVTAPAGQAAGTTTLTVSASASVQGISETQFATASLTVQPVSTSFLGRTVVQDPVQTPLAGVTITLLGVDGNGNATGCSGQTVSDAGGNFMIANLPPACVGTQLIRYDGTTATSPPGTYAGVDLLYTFVAGQVTTPPVLIHLPRIDNAESKMVQQNFPSDQIFTFASIPFLSVTVYAGTTLTLADGTQPNPFPLVAVQVPVDRLPDVMPPSSTTVSAFIVAFQPANSVASQPVAVTFPNTLNTPPGTQMDLDTLDPTKGVMVKYGTGTVSADATQIVPDPDPAHPGHNFGLVHFDWHGPMPAPQQPNPSPDPNGPKAGDPVDLATGLLVLTNTDVAIRGARRQIAIARVYRSLSAVPGPFGIGTNLSYGFGLDTAFPNLVSVINLVMPDGSRFPFAKQPDGTFINSTIPGMLGGVMTIGANSSVDLRSKTGTTFHFVPVSFQVGSVPTSITDANGNTITLTRNPANLTQITQITDPVGRSLTLGYDASGRIVSVTDPIGRAVRYTYNSQGTLATFTDAVGGVATYSYNAQNQLTQITDPRGITFLQNTYDANGRVVQQTHGDGGVTTFAYTLQYPSAASQSPVLLTEVTDPLGNQTTYHFNPQGFLLDVTDALGEMTVYARDPESNELLSATDPLGRTTSFTYDSAGNLTSITRLAGTTGAVTTSFTYEPVFSRLNGITDPLNHTVSIAHDGSGNPIVFTDALNHKTTLAYDSTGELVSITDPLGNTTQLEYTNGDLVRITDPLGRAATRVFDLVSRVVSVTNPLGQTTQFQHDLLNRFTQITDALGGQASFRYDPNENLLSAADASGHSTTYTYDAMNRRTTRTDPSGHTDSYQYDLAGNLVQLADRRGKVTTFSYDALNRRIFVGFGTQPGPTYESTISYTNDAADRRIRAVDSVTGAIVRTFDGLDRLASEITPQGTISYAYDAADRRTSMTVAGQAAVSYSYDGANRLTQLAQGTSTVSFGYDALNRRTTLTLPNGVTASYTYDAASELAGVTHQLGSTTLGNLTYTYDNAGRTISVAGSFARTGLPAGVASASYNAGNQLTKFGTASLIYDSNGNLTNDGTNVYTWDARNQLTSITSGNSTTASFQYDPIGRRVSKTVGGATTSFLYDAFNPAQELVGNTPSANLLTGLGVDEVFSRTDSGGARYFLTGTLGSTIALTDSAGAIQTSYTYEPFGNTVSNGPVSLNSFQFTGRENDATGLYYYRARYYRPTFQRFISEDPIGFGGGDLNLHAYVGNNPISFSDPSGYDKKRKRDKCVQATLRRNYGDFLADKIVPNFSLLTLGENLLNPDTSNATTWEYAKIAAEKTVIIHGSQKLGAHLSSTITASSTTADIGFVEGSGILLEGAGILLEWTLAPLGAGVGGLATAADIGAQRVCSALGDPGGGLSLAGLVPD